MERPSASSRRLTGRWKGKKKREFEIAAKGDEGTSERRAEEEDKEERREKEKKRDGERRIDR